MCSVLLPNVVHISRTCFHKSYAVHRRLSSNDTPCRRARCALALFRFHFYSSLFYANGTFRLALSLSLLAHIKPDKSERFSVFGRSLQPFTRKLSPLFVPFLFSAHKLESRYIVITRAHSFRPFIRACSSLGSSALLSDRCRWSPPNMHTAHAYAEKKMLLTTVETPEMISEMSVFGWALAPNECAMNGSLLLLSEWSSRHFTIRQTSESANSAEARSGQVLAARVFRVVLTLASNVEHSHRQRVLGLRKRPASMFDDYAER